MEPNHAFYITKPFNMFKIKQQLWISHFFLDSLLISYNVPPLITQSLIRFQLFFQFWELIRQMKHLNIPSRLLLKTLIPKMLLQGWEKPSERDSITYGINHRQPHYMVSCQLHAQFLFLLLGSRVKNLTAPPARQVQSSLRTAYLLKSNWPGFSRVKWLTFLPIISLNNWPGLKSI